MSTSSQPEDYSITFTDSITLDCTDVTTLGNMNSNTFTFSTGYAAAASYSVGSTLQSSPTITISTLDTTSAIWGNQEWVNSFPDWNRIENMCSEFPGLRIAFEKFKTTYKLVKDEYDSPTVKK